MIGELFGIGIVIVVEDVLLVFTSAIGIVIVVEEEEPPAIAELDIEIEIV